MSDLSPALVRFGNVSVRLSVELGRADMPLRDVLALGQGSVVALNRLTDELLDITANGKVIARGEVIALDGRFAMRIVDVVGEEQPDAPWTPPARAAAPPEAPPQPTSGSANAAPQAQAAPQTPPSPPVPSAPPDAASAPAQTEPAQAAAPPSGDASHEMFDELADVLAEIAPASPEAKNGASDESAADTTADPASPSEDGSNQV